MKEQSEVNLFSQKNNKKLERKPSKKQIQFIVQSLIKKRQEHEAKIDKLIGRIHSQDVTQVSKSNQEEEFSNILKQLQNSQNFGKEDSKISVGAFSNHVNLLATVSLKTEYFLLQPPQHKMKNQGMLISSLIKRYGTNKMSCLFGDSKSLSEISEALNQTVEYLRAEEMEEGLFVQINQQQTLEHSEYRGTKFCLGKYEEVQLSIQELSQQQKQLVLIEKQSGKTLLNISWLLLSRLINNKHIGFPETLNLLFSYPLKTFKVSQSLSLIAFNQLLSQFNKVEEQFANCQLQKIKIFGIQEKTGTSYEIENLSKAKNIKHYTQLVQRFNKLVLLVQEQLPVKHIPLSCLQNHFVVVSLSVKNRGRYFLSVGSANSLSQFRIYILDSSQNVVNGGFLKNGEFMFSFLREETYEVYIHPQPRKAVQGEMEESFELVKDQQQNFTLWIQSRSIFSKNGDLNFQIRLKQEYNSFTATIAKNYLKKTSNNFQHEQQLLSEEQQFIIIRREAICSLSLFVDTFLCGQKRLEVAYKGVHNLTDCNFRQTKATVKNNQSLYLYKNADIQSLSVINGKDLQKANYKLVINYL